MDKKSGKVVIPNGVSVWPHELFTADALAKEGYTVTFLVVNGIRYSKSADVMIAGKRWEIKSPRADKLSAIERNLKKASKQSSNIIIDSHRMRKIYDKSIHKLLVQKYKQQKVIKNLLFINPKREVIDISNEPK